MLLYILIIAAIAVIAVFVVLKLRKPQLLAQITAGGADAADGLRGLGNGKFVVYGIVAVFVLLLVFVYTSTVSPSGDQIALMDRVYLCKPISDGRNVALEGECGKQADVIMPGFQFIPFVGILNNISMVDMQVVPDGAYANLTAKDGIQPEAGQVASKPWTLGMNTFTSSDGKTTTGNMLDATFFLESGLGRKGPQATVLTPGKYVINPYLWDVDVSKGKSPDGDKSRVDITLGEVGVVTSAIDEDVVPAFFAPSSGEKADCGKEKVQDLGQIKATLVSPGCRGVWREPLKPGKYFVNKDLYKITVVDTRLQNWTYAGGYTRRIIDLQMKDDGSIEQVPSTEDVSVPQGAAGEAVNVTVDGWQIYQEVRLQARVTPEQAPLVVAAVGTPEQVEDRIISPQVRSVLRNIGGSRITVKNTVAYEEAKADLDALKARYEVLKSANADASMADGLNTEQRTAEMNGLDRQIASYSLPNPDDTVTRSTRPIDFQSERATLEGMVSQEIQKFGEETGIEIVQVAFGKTDLPPELLVARKVEQLAVQQRQALIQQRTAQVQRQATEAAKARADKQGALVQASIDVDVSRQKIDQRKNEGEADKAYSVLQAEGNKAKVDVLGQDRVFAAGLFQSALDVLKDKPEILTQLRLPNTVVMGGGSSLEGMAAVFKGAIPNLPTQAPNNQ